MQTFHIRSRFERLFRHDGAGFDAFLAARQVGPAVHVIGVDMTPEMIARANTNLDRTNPTHVEFRLGSIEHLPAHWPSVRSTEPTGIGKSLTDTRTCPDAPGALHAAQWRCALEGLRPGRGRRSSAAHTKGGCNGTGQVGSAS